MSTISPEEIVDLIAALKTRYEGLELRLCDANARGLRDRLLAGELEAVIYALPGEETDERTHVIPLFSEQMVIAVHQSSKNAAPSRLLTLAYTQREVSNYVDATTATTPYYRSAETGEQNPCRSASRRIRTAPS